jgi:hypothetical protein
MLADGPRCALLQDVRACMFSLPEATQLQQPWWKSAELVSATSNRAGVAEALTRQVERALLMEGRLNRRPVQPNSVTQNDSPGTGSNWAS